MLLIYTTPLRTLNAIEMDEAESESGSPGGTRTPDQVVTSALTFLPGLDYLITPPLPEREGCRALLRFIG